VTLSVGPVTDYLVAAATTAVTGTTVSGKPVTVVDGEPSILAPGMFVIGAPEPPPDGGQAETRVARAWNGLGARQVLDDYTIPCYIDVRIAGTDTKAARDAAEAIFNAFWPLLKADLTLGGALDRICEIPDIAAFSSNLGTVAEPGRRHLIQFGVHCRNQTT
jgi:hypothetical protein